MSINHEFVQLISLKRFSDSVKALFDEKKFYFKYKNILNLV
ncbi:hypothetical protein CLV57_0223 [Mucilaginibacter auburnensis]|uniref:Uncharacterized protein n=1 Tax=Mucilaginibacter auburnensis TaxID=1457233 RepID=A0A2H9VR04_9SPHI|nr:hypothetical protein CLV57_0223 [Mucilaginibacter auburnensis]